MITVGRLEDTQAAELVVKELWDKLSDDSEISADDFVLPMGDDNRWYASIEDGDLVGVYGLHRQNHITWQAHVNFRPKYWGTGKPLEHSKETLPILFDDSGAKKIVAIIPEFCKEVIQHVEALGFELEGTNKASFQKNGVVYDQLHFGYTQPEQ